MKEGVSVDIGSPPLKRRDWQTMALCARANTPLAKGGNSHDAMVQEDEVDEASDLFDDETSIEKSSGHSMDLMM